MINLPKPQGLSSDLAYVESARSRLYFAHLGTGEVAVDLGRNSEVLGCGPAQRLGTSMSLGLAGVPGGTDHEKEGTIPASVAALIPSWSDPRSDEVGWL